MSTIVSQTCFLEWHTAARGGAQVLLGLLTVRASIIPAEKGPSDNVQAARCKRQRAQPQGEKGARRRCMNPLASADCLADWQLSTQAATHRAGATRRVGSVREVSKCNSAASDSVERECLPKASKSYNCVVFASAVTSTLPQTQRSEGDQRQSWRPLPLARSVESRSGAARNSFLATSPARTCNRSCTFSTTRQGARCRDDVVRTGTTILNG
eukprot:365252-Chlamydomonas_euryale.AAC.45